MCILCQQTSPKRCFGNRTMTSFCDFTNSAHQIQMTTLCRWMNPPHEKFLRTPLQTMNYFLVLYNHAYHATSSTLLCGLFRIYCFVTLNFSLSRTICWSVKLKSPGTSWDSFHETKQTKAWSSMYCSHNAAEQQWSKTCFCSCLQQKHIDFLFHKLLTSPVIKNSPMTCLSSFFETSSKFPVFCKVYALVFSGKSSNICFE